MPINPERITRLISLGLNEQQARAYLALLDVDTATANELAKASRVPRAKLYEVLESLGRKGLLEIIPDSPQRFRANALTGFYDTRVEELRSEERQLKRTIGELMVQLVPHPRDAAAEAERDFVLISRGRGAIVTACKQLVDRAEKRILVVGDTLILARLRLYEDLLSKLAAFASYGDLRVLVPSNVVTVVDGRRIHLDEIAESIRVLPFAGGEACMVYRDEAEIVEVHYVPNDLHPTRGSDRIIVNRESEVAKMQSRIFDALWETARPLVPAR